MHFKIKFFLSIIILVCWYFFASKIIPTPHEIIFELPSLWFKGLGYELYLSLLVNLKALIISFVLSLVICYSTVLPGIIGQTFTIIAGWISSLRFLGLVGLTLVFTLMTSSGHMLKVSLLVFGITTFMVTGIYDIVSNIPKERFDDARTLRMSTPRVIYEVVILGTMAECLDVLRSCGAISWVMLSSVEGLVLSEGGLGGAAIIYSKYFQLTDLFVVQLVILLVGLGFDIGFRILRRILCPYRYLLIEKK